MNSNENINTKTIVCPHCSATEFTFVSHGLAKCAYCGATIVLPKKEQPRYHHRRSQLSIFDLAQNIVEEAQEVHPRENVVRPLKRALPVEKAKKIANIAFKKTLPLWIASVIVSLVAVAMLIYTACCLGQTDAIITSVVPSAVVLVMLIVTSIFNTKAIKKPLLEEQKKLVQAIDEELSAKDFAPLNEEEKANAKAMTNVNISYIRMRTNALQAVAIALCPLILLACIIISPIRANTVVVSSGTGQYHSCYNSHTDLDNDGICDYCNDEFVLQYFGFTLNNDGNGYTLTWVSDSLTAKSPTSKTQVTIPSTFNGVPVTAIGTGAFADKGRYVTVVVPSSITTIMPDAFENNKLSELVFEDTSDWYLVEEGQWLSDISKWMSTGKTMLNLQFFYGDNTWTKTVQ